MYSNIIVSINGFNVIITLNGIYIEYIKIICTIFVKYIVPYYKFIQTILLYFLKLLQMTFIIIIIIITLYFYN